MQNECNFSASRKVIIITNFVISKILLYQSKIKLLFDFRAKRGNLPKFCILHSAFCIYSNLPKSDAAESVEKHTLVSSPTR